MARKESEQVQLTLLAIEYASGLLSLVLFRIEHIYDLRTQEGKLNRHFKLVLAVGGLLSGDDHKIDGLEGHLLKVTLPPSGWRFVSAFDFLFIGSLIARRQDRRLSEELELELNEQLAAQPIEVRPVKIKLTYSSEGESVLQAEGTCAACVSGTCEIEGPHT